MTQFYQNRFINVCARKNLSNIQAFLWDIEVLNNLRVIKIMLKKNEIILIITIKIMWNILYLGTKMFEHLERERSFWFRIHTGLILWYFWIQSIIFRNKILFLLKMILSIKGLSTCKISVFVQLKRDTTS